MAPSLSYSSRRKLNNNHYCISRTIYNDRRCQLSRNELDKLSNRANPTQWSNYIAASTAITLGNNDDTPMGQMLRTKVYRNDRHQGKVKFISTARRKIGEQDLSKRLGFFSNITCDWYDKDISKDALRVTLKSAFFE